MAIFYSLLSIIFYSILAVIVLAVILAMFAWSANSIDDAIVCKLKARKDGMKVKMRHGYIWATYWAGKLSDGTYQIVFTEDAPEIKSLLPCTKGKKLLTQNYFREYLMEYHKDIQVIEIITNYPRKGG